PPLRGFGWQRMRHTPRLGGDLEDFTPARLRLAAKAWRRKPAMKLSESNEEGDKELPKGVRGGRAIRAVLNAAGGAIPFVGGLLSSAAGAWSEQEQQKVNQFFEHWLRMIEADMAEKAQTILEIMARLDMNDQKTAERVESPEYQALVRKAFRD